MNEKSDRKELERRLEQAKRAAALLNDPVTTKRLLKLVKDLEGAAQGSRVGARLGNSPVFLRSITRNEYARKTNSRVQSIKGETLGQRKLKRDE